MSGPVKIASLELENVKRVRALALEPKADGLTVIGGRNGQGKTSVLDAIAWALGGERKRPDRPTRDGSATPASLRVELSNGLVVERRGKNGSLKVTDPEGRRAGQQLVNSLVEELALDLPRFMAMTDREKADELLRIVGVGGQLAELDAELKRVAAQRTAVGQQKRAKRKAAEDAAFYPDAPDELVSASELLGELDGIKARNAENARKRDAAKGAAAEEGRALKEMESARAAYEAASARYKDAARAAEAARAGATGLADEPTEGVERRIAELDSVNAKVMANRQREQMLADADALDEEHAALEEQVADVRSRRTALLEGADMPLPGLSVEDGRLLYRGATWGGMSASEQLRVATAIVRRLKPECGFVLVDKLEQMDPATLAEFGAWAESEGLQVIGTRVATDDGTCTVVIEDGRAVREPGPAEEQKAPEKKRFTEGVF